jgi:hypothetical protein
MELKLGIESEEVGVDRLDRVWNWMGEGMAMRNVISTWFGVRSLSSLSLLIDVGVIDEGEHGVGDTQAAGKLSSW